MFIFKSRTSWLKLYSVRTDNFLGDINWFFCPCFLCPTLSASPRIRPQAALCPRRSEAPGERGRGPHCEFARVSTSMGVWIGARLVITYPVSFVSPVLISCFLVQATPFGCFSPKIAHFRVVVGKFLTTFSSYARLCSKVSETILPN